MEIAYQLSRNLKVLEVRSKYSTEKQEQLDLRQCRQANVSSVDKASKLINSEHLIEALISGLYRGIR
jgi:hypothetical protein